MEIYQLVKPLGIAAYALFGLTFFIGLLRKYIPLKKKMVLHKWLAVTAVTCATLHFILVIKYY